MLTWRDVMGRLVRAGEFEANERLFLEGFIKPGMVTLDVGAHNGYYSLLFATLVGQRGRVAAFEPSQRERRRLRWNLAINRYSNITVEPYAVGAEDGQTDFYIINGDETGFNSRRKPGIAQPTHHKTVPLIPLDKYAEDHNLTAIDILKMDVEGGELDVLCGARRILASETRPLVLCEVSDERTTPWGYKAQLIYDYLVDRGYAWFAIEEGGRLRPMPGKTYYHENLLAVPRNRFGEVQLMITQRS
jgi:FkbM family methyltransferase